MAQTTKTGFMKIVCGECQEKFPMYPNRLWYNFTDEKFAHPIGFCSPECLEVYAARRKWA